MVGRRTPRPEEDIATQNRWCMDCRGAVHGHIGGRFLWISDQII